MDTGHFFLEDILQYHQIKQVPIWTEWFQNNSSKYSLDAAVVLVSYNVLEETLISFSLILYPVKLNLIYPSTKNIF